MTTGRRDITYRRMTSARSRRASASVRGADRAPRRRRGRTRPRPHRPLLGHVARIALLVALALGLTAVVVYLVMASRLPDPDLAHARGRDQSTTIRDVNGKLIAKLYAEEDRTDVPLAKIPIHLRQAVIAVEDRRFYQHEGIDPIGIARALVVDVIRREKAQGGSTITQQYVKQAFVTDEKTVRRKIQEAILAQRIEAKYTKDQILERYLNTIYFGHGAYGVEAAARVYFGKSVSELDLAEAALLAGVIKSPGRYSPYLEPDAAKRRRDLVLDVMLEQGLIDAAEHRGAVREPIRTVGLKPSSTRAPYFVEWVKGLLVDELGERQVYRGGLTVRTTLDLRLQNAAERAIATVLDRPGDPSAALVALRPGTGEVLAMVGGRDFSTQQFNVAVQGRRQPGSAFKTFVLAAALDAGVNPEKTYDARPARLRVGDTVWRVTGASGADAAHMRLRRATERSINAVFARLILEIGPEAVVTMARTAGIDEQIAPNPAIALGGLDRGVSPLSMAEAYATFAANGVHAEPFPVLRVEGPDGSVLMSTQPRTRRAVEPAVAYLVTDILSGVITRGTGRAARLGRPAAGKTGTTQRYRDAWFVGYTPDLACAVWVGYPDAQREMTAVHGAPVTGGSLPAMIWRAFMAEALKGTPASRFLRPKGLTTRTLCRETGSLATSYCPEPFRALTLVRSRVASCTVHTQPTEVTVPSVVGLTKADALALLTSLRLTGSIVETDVAGVPTGIVASQSPRAGSTLAPGSLVRLTVSTGAARNQPPAAAFTPPEEARAGQPVELDGSASTDDGRIVTYYWEFGDGSSGQGRRVTHTWAAAGTYDVTLWVTDDRGAQGAVTHRITVR